MKGFPQWFFCPTAIFRAGPEAENFGDKWTYAVLVAFPWLQILRWLVRRPARAMVWALSADGKLKWSHARPLFHWVRGHRFEPDWKRINDEDDGTPAAEFLDECEAVPMIEIDGEHVPHPTIVARRQMRSKSV